MALAPDVKTRIIEEYATHPGDTGSPDVQAAIIARDAGLAAGPVPDRR